MSSLTQLLNMHNDSGHIHCENCEMKRLDDIMWAPGLLIKLVSLSVLAVLTTGANVFLIYIAFRTKSLVSNTKVFVISLCLAHLLGSLIIIPLWIITRLVPDLARDSPIFCQTSAFMWILMTLASFYSLSAISVDRFCIISNPMRYPVKATTPKKLLAVGAIWVTCAAFASAPEFGWGEYKFNPDAIPICELNIKQSLSYAIMLLFLGFLTPLLVDIICCARIIAIAMRQSRAIESRKGSISTSSISSAMSATSGTHLQPSLRLSKLKQKLNSLRLVFAGTGNFLICWLPYIAAHVWMTGITNVSHDSESIPYILEIVVMFLALLNGFINPVVIMFSNRDYTKRIKLLMFRRFGLFKDEIVDDPSDNESSVTNLRRSQQYKSVNLIELFQNLNQITENTTSNSKSGIKNDEKAECVLVTESCLCYDDVKSQQKCLAASSMSNLTEVTQKTNPAQSERRRLMSNMSNSSSFETENGFKKNEPTQNENQVASSMGNLTEVPRSLTASERRRIMSTRSNSSLDTENGFIPNFPTQTGQLGLITEVNDQKHGIGVKHVIIEVGIPGLVIK